MSPTLKSPDDSPSSTTNKLSCLLTLPGAAHTRSLRTFPVAVCTTHALLIRPQHSDVRDYSIPTIVLHCDSTPSMWCPSMMVWCEWRASFSLLRVHTPAALLRTLILLRVDELPLDTCVGNRRRRVVALDVRLRLRQRGRCQIKRP